MHKSVGVSVVQHTVFAVSGEFDGIELPAKRLFGSKGLDYLESKRAAFQTYLQVSGNLY